PRAARPGSTRAWRRPRGRAARAGERAPRDRASRSAGRDRPRRRPQHAVAPGWCTASTSRGVGAGARRSDVITAVDATCLPASSRGWTSPEARAQAFGPPVAQHSPVVDSTRTPVVRRVEALVYPPAPRLVKAGRATPAAFL